jgi:hypothetical protein
MGMADRYQANLEKALQARIDGPLIVGTIGSPVGSMSNLLRSEAFGLAGGGASPITRGKAHQKGGKDIRLPQNFAVAVTDTSVYFFKWKPFWGRVRIKRELLRLPREGLHVTPSRGKASATIFLLTADSPETRVAFEMATLGMARAKTKVQEVANALDVAVP